MSLALTCVTPEQAKAHADLNRAIRLQGAQPPCRLEPREWDDKLPHEYATSAQRKQRIEYAQWLCYGCPLMGKECRAVKDSDPTIRGVIAGDLVTDYPLTDDKEDVA